MDLSLLEKIKSFCAYQERSHKEVRSKLLSMEIYGSDLEEYLVVLIEENFLNEERFARALARGKFRIKHWGKNRIKQSLRWHQVSEYCIRKGLEEIDEDEYREVFEKTAQKKWDELRGNGKKLSRLARLKNFLLQRGFEQEIIFEWIRTNETSNANF